VDLNGFSRRVYLDGLKSHCQLDTDFAILKEFKMDLLNGISTDITPNLKLEHKAVIFLFPPTNTLTIFTDLQKQNIHIFVIIKFMSRDHKNPLTIKYQ
jgi:hypothetical protein